MDKETVELKDILTNEKEKKKLKNKKEVLKKKKIFNPLIILLLITTTFMIYFASLNFTKKTNENTIKEKEHKRIINKLISFEAENEQLKLKLEKTIEQSRSLSEEMYVLKEKNKEVKTEEKEKIKEKVITINKVNKKNFNNVYNSNNTKTLKCYDYLKADFNPSKTCIQNLKEFIKENKKALRFQLIAVISNKDKIFFEKNDKKSLELLLYGLAIKRTNEISWHIKKQLNEKTIINSNNFYVESKKGNSGVLLNAYF